MHRVTVDIAIGPGMRVFVHILNCLYAALGSHVKFVRLASHTYPVEILFEKSIHVNVMQDMIIMMCSLQEHVAIVVDWQLFDL